MNYYSYIGEEEPIGNNNRFINRGVKNFKQTATYKTLLKNEHFKVFTFTNFYDEKTYKLVFSR